MKIEHGANLYELSDELGIGKNEILDFSSNINPYGASQKAKLNVIENIDMVSIYPDPDYKMLKSSISQYCNIDEKNIVLGSGATELISAFIKAVNPKKTLLLSPAYSEYERELLRIGCEVLKVYYEKEKSFKIDIERLIERLKDEKPELLIVCNPNNPTGTSLEKNEIEKILNSYPGAIMVDETYIEFTDIDFYSAVELTEKYENIFVIRGTSKFFSTPGIRLGYGVIGAGELEKKLLKSSNLWNINIFATLMGEVMFRDCDYINKTKIDMKKAMEKLKSDLKMFKQLKIYDTTSNFMLCEILDGKITAPELRSSLMREGIIIRDASKFPGLNEKFFRVCVLKDDENQRLIKALKKYLNL